MNKSKHLYVIWNSALFDKPKSTFRVVFHLLVVKLSLQAVHWKNASQTSMIAKLTVRRNNYPGPDDLETFNDTDSGSGYLGGHLLRGNRRLCCVSVRRFSDRNRTPSSGMGISHLSFTDSEGLGLLKVASCRHILFLSSSLTMTI